MIELIIAALFTLFMFMILTLEVIKMTNEPDFHNDTDFNAVFIH